MDKAKFWSLIEEAKQESEGDVEQQVDLLNEKLSLLPPEEILSYHNIFWSLMDESYTWELWAAAYIMRGGCSDDSFDYFRGWLVAQGHSIFEDAMHDPDSLAAVALVTDYSYDYECERMLQVSDWVYEQKTGKESCGHSYIFKEPAGTKWNEEDEVSLARNYPKLWTKFVG